MCSYDVLAYECAREQRGACVRGVQRKSSGGTPFSSSFTTRTEGRVLVADKVPDCFLTPIHRGCAIYPVYCIYDH